MTISPGFLLLAALFFYLDDSSGVIFWTIAAAICHELGHITAALLMGGRTEKLNLGITGAELIFSYPFILPYGRDALVALAGPAVNLLVGALMMCAGKYIGSLVFLCLGLFNLLPIIPLDGGRLMSSLLSQRFGPLCSDRVLAVCSGVATGVLSGFSVILVIEYANFIPLILSGWLLLGTLKK